VVGAGGRGELARRKRIEALALVPRKAAEKRFDQRAFRHVEIAAAFKQRDKPFARLCRQPGAESSVSIRANRARAEQPAGEQYPQLVHSLADKDIRNRLRVGLRGRGRSPSVIAPIRRSRRASTRSPVQRSVERRSIRPASQRSTSSVVSGSAA
jgi:hypothetical protein